MIYDTEFRVLRESSLITYAKSTEAALNVYVRNHIEKMLLIIRYTNTQIFIQK